MSFELLRERLEHGRPLVLDADSGASLRARGLQLDVPGTLGWILRERPEDVVRHHREEIASKVDVISALTADTTPRALAEMGMQHRAATLTAHAIDLAGMAAEECLRAVAVAGVLGSDMVSPVAADRQDEELVEHAARLAAARCELIIARGQGSWLGLMAAVTAAARTELPIWAVLELGVGADLAAAPLSEQLEALRAAGASAALFEVSSVDAALERLEQSRSTLKSTGLCAGVMLASSETAVRGFGDGGPEPERWAARAPELSLAGARIIGGGAGTTEAHTRALAQALGAIHPSLPAARADEGDRSSTGF